MSTLTQNKSVSVQSSPHPHADNDVNTRQSLPRPICWSEGMLLSPQHFQQNHQYWEQQLRQVISLFSPDYWGIKELILNRSSLLEGEVNIKRLVAVMPDGLLIDYSAIIDGPLALTVDVENGPVVVQLTVPVQVAGSASERAEIQRYNSCIDKPRIDENTGENERILSRLSPKLSLQMGNRVGDRYVGLPLLRVIKPVGGTFQLDPDYCPPLLCIGADQFRKSDNDLPDARSLQETCEAIAIAVRQKARQLAGLSNESDSLGRNITQRHHRWIRAMVQDLVTLELLAENANTKPIEMYQGLIRMAGSVSELDPNNIPPRFNAYIHDNCLPAFHNVILYIRQQTERVNLSYTTLSFDEEREGIFTLEYDKAWEGKDLLIELRPNTSSNREGVISWLKSSRIASLNVHKALEQGRLLGATVEQIDSDEKTGIVAGSGNVLFKIQANKKLIRAGVKLAVVSTSKDNNDDCPAAILLHMPHE